MSDHAARDARDHLDATEVAAELEALSMAIAAPPSLTIVTDETVPDNTVRVLMPDGRRKDVCLVTGEITWAPGAVVDVAELVEI